MREENFINRLYVQKRIIALKLDQFLQLKIKVNIHMIVQYPSANSVAEQYPGNK